MSEEKEKLGVIGLNALNVAESAEEAGYLVYLVNYHQDSGGIKGIHHPLQRNPLKPNLRDEYSAGKLVDYAIEKLWGEVDEIILTSAVGCNPLLVRRLEKIFHVVGNDYRAVFRARCWRILEDAGVNAGCMVPNTVVVGSKKELFDAFEVVGFPNIIKPCFEGSGFRQRIIRDRGEVDSLGGFRCEMLVQERIGGIPVSCTVLSDGTDAVALTVNMQLIGLREFNAKEFTYCGNIVPYETPFRDEIKKCSEEIVSALGLKGCNGVDYILNERGLYLLEVNSRIPDTIWGVERRLGINLVKEHVLAVDGGMNSVFRGNNKFYGKAVLFADRWFKVESKNNLEGVGNIPPEGTVIQVNEPTCSVYSEGDSKASVLNELTSKSKEVVCGQLNPR